jgi:predicted alpha/beta superfamily hydrolase
MARRATSATIGASRRIDFTSKVDARRYRVQIATPYAPPPADGYPVLYVLDGGAYFATFADAARLRCALAGELEPAIVVGVGYADEDMQGVMRRRYFDLTPTPPDPADAALDEQSMGEIRGGGADAFLRIIETEVKPRVAGALPVDANRSLLVGHSLGGLFALNVLFTKPTAFETYLALSPSIWWNRRVLLRGEDGFARRLAGEALNPRLFIGVGEAEQTPPPRGEGGLSRDQTAERTAIARMVDNAAELAARLAALPGGAGYRVEYALLPGQTHMSAPWAALNAMLDFALGAGRLQRP